MSLRLQCQQLGHKSMLNVWLCPRTQMPVGLAALESTSNPTGQVMSSLFPTTNATKRLWPRLIPKSDVGGARLSRFQEQHLSDLDIHHVQVTHKRQIEGNTLVEWNPCWLVGGHTRNNQNNDPMRAHANLWSPLNHAEVATTNCRV